MNPLLRVPLDLFFPSSCLLCREPRDARDSRVVCLACRRAMPRAPEIQPWPTENLSLLMSAGVYRGRLRDLIHHFKYNGRDYLASNLSGYMRGSLGPALSFFDGIVPVPMGLVRSLARGYNQTHLLAGELSRRLSIPMETGLLRRRWLSASQTRLSRSARRRNARRSFLPHSRIRTARGRSLLLVDDVVTTGSTLDRCAELLRQAGARTVSAAVIARDE